MGLLEIYKVQDLQGGKLHKMQSVSFKVQVICCAFNEVLGLVAVGADDGHVILFSLQFDQGFRLQ